MILLTFTLELQILWNKKENTIPIWKLLKLFYWLYGCQTTINLKSRFWLITKFKTNEYFWLWQEPNEAQFYDCQSILYKALGKFRTDFKADENQANLYSEFDWVSITYHHQRRSFSVLSCWYLWQNAFEEMSEVADPLVMPLQCIQYELLCLWWRNGCLRPNASQIKS